jgi:hypothetical protein
MIPQAADITRAALIEHMQRRQVVIGARQGERVHVVIDTGKTTTQGWIPLDWVKPMLDPAAHGRAGR